MKILKTILVIAIIVGLGFCGYYGYNYFKKWEANKYSEITMLKFNQEMFLKKVTALSESITHIVNDTAKTTVVVKPDNTYESLKEQVIELKKNENANKDEINSLKEKLSEQRQAFLASDDTILIKTAEGNLLLYRDASGSLQPASEGIEKIIEHKDVSNIPIPIKEVELDKSNWNIKAGGYYNISDKGYGLILSKGILSIKNYSLNISLLSDLQSLEGIKLGANINYSISNSLELGVGITMDKTYFMCLEYSF